MSSSLFKKTGTGTDTWQVAVTMVAALFLGFLAVAISLADNGTVWRGLMWAAAWSAAGWFLGFVFGIPRYLSTDTARKPATLAPDAAKKAFDDATAKADAEDRDCQVLQQAAAANGLQADADKAGVAATAAAKARAAADDARRAWDQATQSGASGQSLTVNTNLEQISDWLTKIIVGVSLVESQTLLANLKAAALFMALAMDKPGMAEATGPSAARAPDALASAAGAASAAASAGAPLVQAMAAHAASAAQAASQAAASTLAATPMSSFAYAIILYFLATGLLGSYLLTRLFLQLALDNAAHQ